MQQSHSDSNNDNKNYLPVVTYKLNTTWRSLGMSFESPSGNPEWEFRGFPKPFKGTSGLSPNKSPGKVPSGLPENLKKETEGNTEEEN